MAKKRTKKSVKVKEQAVLRLLRGEDLELVSRQTGFALHELSRWRDKFIMAGRENLKSHPKDPPHAELEQRENLSACGGTLLNGCHAHGHLRTWACCRRLSPWPRRLGHATQNTNSYTFKLISKLALENEILKKPGRSRQAGSCRSPQNGTAIERRGKYVKRRRNL